MARGGQRPPPVLSGHPDLTTVAGCGQPHSSARQGLGPPSAARREGEASRKEQPEAAPAEETQGWGRGSWRREDSAEQGGERIHWPGRRGRRGAVGWERAPTHLK